MTQQVKVENIMLIFAKQSPILQKNMKLSYLQAFFMKKAIIFTQKLKTRIQCSIHI